MSSTKQLILDIATNLNRIGNWVADDFKTNEKKIDLFIRNNDGYIKKVKNLDQNFKPTYEQFLRVYPRIKSDLKNSAEILMTWGNILTHRSKLLN